MQLVTDVTEASQSGQHHIRSHNCDDAATMRCQLLLVLPPVLAFSIDDVHPPMWSSPKSWSTPTPLSEGTCSSAVDVMAFHRDKMNEYLCRQFLAEEILESEAEHRIQDRALPALMEDSGSEGYKDWLARLVSKLFYLIPKSINPR